MTVNETVEAVQLEINRDPFAKTYTISGSLFRNLVRLSDYGRTRQILINSLRVKNDRLRSALTAEKLENKKLKEKLEKSQGASL